MKARGGKHKQLSKANGNADLEIFGKCQKYGFREGMYLTESTKLYIVCLRYENSILVRLLFRVVEIQRISEATATP